MSRAGIVGRSVMRTRSGSRSATKQASCSARVGLSPGRLGARFRAAAGCSLKVYVDRACAATAARLLEYSDFGVSVIAEQLGFQDQFAFSRFFKRLQGVTGQPGAACQIADPAAEREAGNAHRLASAGGDRMALTG